MRKKDNGFKTWYLEFGMVSNGQEVSKTIVWQGFKGRHAPFLGYPTIELLESDRCEIQVVAKHRVSDWNKIKNGGFLETSWPLGKLAAQLKLAGNKPKIAPIRILVKAVESKGFSSDVVFSNIGLEMGTMDQKTFRPWTKKRNVYLGSNKEPSKSQASATCLSFPINAQKTYDHGTELVHLASTDILDQNADARFLLAVEWKTLLQSPYVTMDAKVRGRAAPLHCVPPAHCCFFEGGQDSDTWSI